MGIKTAIEWCDSSVNAVMGCDGCELYSAHCYANRLCTRYAGHKGWPREFNQPEHFPGRIEKALRWPDLTGTERPDKPWLNGMPRLVFVNDMGDGFCSSVDPLEWLAPSFQAMSESPHIWLLLTKWPHSMRVFFQGIFQSIPANFWLGTTVTSSDTLWRIDELLHIRGASVLFVSLEPLLSEIDVDIHLVTCPDCGGGGYLDDEFCGCNGQWNTRLDWVIVGAETGPGARPMHPDWARSVRDQCVTAGVPFFFKRDSDGSRLLDGQLWEQMPETGLD